MWKEVVDIGALIQEEIDAARKSDIARALGSIKTPRKSQASRENINRLNERKKREGVSEATKAKLREAQQRRREREKEERAALGLDADAPTEKKPVGRPKKQIAVADVHEPKRGRGRPRKEAAPNA